MLSPTNMMTRRRKDDEESHDGLPINTNTNTNSCPSGDGSSNWGSSSLASFMSSLMEQTSSNCVQHKHNDEDDKDDTEQCNTNDHDHANDYNNSSSSHQSLRSVSPRSMFKIQIVEDNARSNSQRNLFADVDETTKPKKCRWANLVREDSDSDLLNGRRTRTTGRRNSLLSINTTSATTSTTSTSTRNCNQVTLKRATSDPNLFLQMPRRIESPTRIQKPSVRTHRSSCSPRKSCNLPPRCPLPSQSPRRSQSLQSSSSLQNSTTGLLRFNSRQNKIGSDSDLLRMPKRRPSPSGRRGGLRQQKQKHAAMQNAMWDATNNNNTTSLVVVGGRDKSFDTTALSSSMSTTTSTSTSMFDHQKSLSIPDLLDTSNILVEERFTRDSVRTPPMSPTKGPSTYTSSSTSSTTKTTPSSNVKPKLVMSKARLMSPSS